ncbi:MAG: 3-deoxy-8-phosphooctulonate synthase [Candidatus Omnitrophica bacterium]|nr:3-deoxy-8-phosphooctulonate synthase [Candidatus Omnitrophota bacterium]
MKNVSVRPAHASAVTIGGITPFALIAGPCVIEREDSLLRHAETLCAITGRLGIPFIFKASYDKANRSSVASYRGPGPVKGLKLLAKVRRLFDVPVTSDVHSAEEAAEAGAFLDMIQVPAFLCRQTDILLAAGKTGKCVNVKKGQFLAPWDIGNIIRKVESTGNKNILITERGTTFGYNNLVSDMRSIPLMREYGCPVCYDATHSVQKPGGLGDKSGGDSRFVPYLSRAAIACGADALFIEVHEDPRKALSDGANMVRLGDLERLLEELKAIEKVLKEKR